MADFRLFSFILMGFWIASLHGSFNHYEGEFLAQPQKLAEWTAMKNKVEGWTDGLGLPIDEGIRETVVALNLLGFKTRQSCEGHLDWGCACPWIDFDLGDGEDQCQEMSKELNLQRRLAPLYLLIGKFYRERQGSYDRMICLSNRGVARMQSLGGDWQLGRSGEEREVKLAEYREEMDAFTDFLIREYLENQ